MEERDYQNPDPNVKDDTYAALDPRSRSSDDVYNTLTTVHSSPSDDLYTALDPQSRSPDYDTLACSTIGRRRMTTCTQTATPTVLNTTSPSPRTAVVSYQTVMERLRMAADFTHILYMIIQAALLIPLTMTLTVHLLFLLFSSGAAAQNGWGVTYNPTSICAVKGSTVNMSCTYTHPSGYSVMKAFWTKQSSVQNGVESPDLLDDPDYRGRVQYLRDKQHNTTLRLQNVTEKDQIKYYFRFLTNQTGGRWTGEGGVDLKVTGLQVEIPERVMEGGNVTLTCNTTCSLTVTPTFTWYRGGRRLSSSTDHLHLQPVSREDAGRYHCAALDQNSPEVTLNVRYGPKSVSVSISPPGYIVEGSSVNLTCSSDANPPVNYTWYEEGGDSPVGSGHCYSALQNGSYYCVAQNEYGSQKSAAVTVTTDLHTGNTVLYAVTGVGVGVGCVSVIIAVVCLRKKQRGTSADDANQPQASHLQHKMENLYSSVMKRSTTEGATPDLDPSNQDDVCYASVKHHKVNNPGNAESSAGTASALNTNEDVQYASVCFTHTGATNRKRKKRAMEEHDYQNPDPHAKDDTYAALEPRSRSSDDAYNTLTTVHSSPSDDLYTALDPQSRSPDYDTLAVSESTCTDQCLVAAGAGRPSPPWNRTTTMNTGVPQGCVLSPLLFTLLTNDCCAKYNTHHIIRFVDGTTVVGHISNGDDSAYREEKDGVRRLKAGDVEIVYFKAIAVHSHLSSKDRPVQYSLNSAQLSPTSAKLSPTSVQLSLTQSSSV
ncbi:hypothetical protein NFI96_031890 [Prochilodus magdalenae]|nr:hypothetical protein NFI96_031890 [Prochilodus magdalenae]